MNMKHPHFSFHYRIFTWVLLENILREIVVWECRQTANKSLFTPRHHDSRRDPVYSRIEESSCAIGKLSNMQSKQYLNKGYFLSKLRNSGSKGWKPRETRSITITTLVSLLFIKKLASTANSISINWILYLIPLSHLRKPKPLAMNKNYNINPIFLRKRNPQSHTMHSRPIKVLRKQCTQRIFNSHAHPILLRWCGKDLSNKNINYSLVSSTNLSCVKSLNERSSTRFLLEEITVDDEGDKNRPISRRICGGP